MIQKPTSLKYEPSLELLLISADHQLPGYSRNPFSVCLVVGMELGGSFEPRMALDMQKGAFREARANPLRSHHIPTVENH